MKVNKNAILDYMVRCCNDKTVPEQGRIVVTKGRML